MKYGTLDFKIEDNERYFLVEATFEVELMVKRLIPSQWGHPIHIRVHPENTRILRMVMNEYPFEIKTDYWKTAQEEIKEYESLAASVEKLEYVVPNEGHFIGKLLPFQQQCLDFMNKTQGKTLITDEMGLGKTIETISFIAQNPQTTLPAIIVAPLVTLINWKREIERFLRLENSKDGQNKLFDETTTPKIEIIRKGKGNSLKPADFYIINYDLVTKRFKHLSEINAKTMVLDECQYLRNNTTRRYDAVKSLARNPQTKHVIGLSGTPIYNRGIEMYNIVEVIKPGVLGERDEFIRRYCMQWNANETDENSRAGLASALRKTIMIRRKKIEVLHDLPDKVRVKQELQIDQSLYVREMQKLYKDISEAKTYLAGKTIENERKEGLFQLNKKIREMRLKERQIAGMAKTPYILDYLKSLLEDYDEEKFVIFCHHRSVHEALVSGLWFFEPVQVIGGQSDKERQAAIDKFQTDKNCRAIICGLRAGNVGINLTAAAYVIFAELDWSPSIHRQAEDRLHRIGQKQNVIAHYLEGMGTFDEIISQILLNKTVEINNALGDKMERMNNQKALEYIQSKFKIQGSTEIGKLLLEIEE